MKKQLILFVLPAVLLACGPAGSTNDRTGDAASTGNPSVARRVTGTRLLTTDYNYTKICNFLDDGFMRGTFAVEPLVELTVLTSQKGCTYQWEDEKVTVRYGDGNLKPYASIYDAERSFNKRYQPKAIDEKAMKSGESVGSTRLTKPPYSTKQNTAIPGVGDKALWNSDEKILHVLYLQHIFSVQLNTDDSLDKQRKQATKLALLIIDKLEDASHG